MVKSLQEILRNRQQEEFVGREEQLAFFQANLGLSPEDPRRRFVVAVSGQGGVGKTWLLRRFHKVAEEAGAIIACTDETEGTVLEVMACVAEEFAARGQRLETFSKQHEIYRRRREEVEAGPDVHRERGYLVRLRQGLIAHFDEEELRTLSFDMDVDYDSLRGEGKVGKARELVGYLDRVGRIPDLVATCKQLRPSLPWVGEVSRALSAVQNVSPGQGMMGEEESTRYVAQGMPEREAGLMLGPVEALTPFFLTDLQKVAAERPVAIFCDTYERTGEFLGAWLRDLIEGRHGNVPANILLVIAGRNELDRNLWAPYEGLLARLPLEPFSEEEAQDYLTRKGVTDGRVVDVILRLSGRLPLLVATLVAESPDDPAKVGDPSGEAIERFLKWVEDPARRQAALDAAFPRLLNRDVVAVLVRDEEADALFTWLKGMPFVEKRGGGWAYHDVVRVQMLRYKRQASPQAWASIHRKLAEYHEGLRDGMGLTEEAGRGDETWQRYELEALYHRLCQSPRDHLSKALQVYQLLHTKGVDFARRRAQTVCVAGTDANDDVVHEQGLRRLRLIEAAELGDHRMIVEMFNILLADGVLKKAQRPGALAGRGASLRELGEYEAALADLEQALELDPDYAWAFICRGTTYRRMQRYDDAMADFTRAVGLAPDAAWIVATRADTYRVVGRYEEALADFNRAIELDPDYGWAIRHRGDTYRLMRQYNKALVDLDHAVELEPERAVNFGARGVIYLQMRQYDKALIDLNRAIELQVDLFWAISSRGRVHRGMKHYTESLADLDRAIELAPWHDWLWANRGLTYLSLRHSEGALNDFNKAIKLRADNDRSLYGRALTYYIMGEDEKARADLRAAMQIDQEQCDAHPWDWRIALHLALCYLALGEAEQAGRLYQEILSGNQPAYKARTASEDIEEFLALFPNHAQARELQGVVEEYLREAER